MKIYVKRRGKGIGNCQRPKTHTETSHHKPASTPISACIDPPHLCITRSHICDNATAAWQMQTKGSPIHHCSDGGGANYTTVKIMTFCCFVCPLREYNAEDGGVEGKKIASQLPCERAHEGEGHTNKTNSHIHTQIQLVSLLPVPRLCLQAWLIQCRVGRFWP